MILVSEDLIALLKQKHIKANIHSRFESAINMLTESYELITVFMEPENISPMSVVITKDRFSDLERHKEKNLELSLQGNRLLLCGGHQILSEEFITWSPMTSYSPVAMGQNLDLSVSCKKMVDAVSIYGNLDGVGPLIYMNETSVGLTDALAFFMPRLQSFIESLCEMELERIRFHSLLIIGFGPGLTPASDDLLSGMLLSLIYFGEHYGLNIQTVRQITRSIVSGIRGLTTLIGERSLIYASEGRVCLKVKRAIDSILNQNQGLEDALIGVIELGATSGTDLLTGMYLGMRLLMDGRINWEDKA
ncbi:MULTISPECIES: DUF2877 domain-containing protein [unclassified Fusibacter]|uniref:DUF2877 domain-containing protein n=1 Tax=unclassified Fusibacter TaxID=2624464 RepID=UPI00101035B2|nr:MULTISPECIES: DUF2877 domain-containing protein [unclassified Fusibacter]MCK8058548.1 DUF2877 domain-containing protein [Fusibacter sp. A2]NPE22683.1 DUF2877 domain-containing protein [Fusibacter sp. A1]RXV60244.1 DUF2877 domain-containing protein [Fusibacter sp. A1]